MRVFFVIDTLANAGTENSYLKLLPKLSEDLVVTLVYLYADHSLLEAFQKSGIQVCFLDIQAKYSFYEGFNKLRHLVGREKPDVIVSSLYRSNLVSRMVCLATGVPLIGTLVNDSYNPTRIGEHKGMSYWKFKIAWLLDKWTSFIPVFWISNSISLVQSHQYTLGINPLKTAVVYRGRNIPKKSFEKKGELKHFIGYGRLIRRKGWTELIDAFVLVNHRYPSCSLTIYGDGPMKSELQAQISHKGLVGKVFLTGNIPNVQEKLYDYDCFVFPSWYEGFSGALVEAMAVGIPIIASEIPMNLEAIKCGENALTYPVQKSSELFDQMIYAIENPEEMAFLGKNARIEAIKRFDSEKIAMDYQAILKKILGSITHPKHP